MGVFCCLSDTSLEDLIAAAQASPADDTPAMAEILRRFEGASLTIASVTTTGWHQRQDAAQGARLGLVRAVRGHKPGTAGFSSYARIYMRGEARRVADHMGGTDFVCEVDLVTTSQSESRPGVLRAREPSNDSAGPPFSLEEVMRQLTPQQQSLVRDRYVGECTLSEIAAARGVTVAAISQRLTTIHKALRSVLTEERAA